MAKRLDNKAALITGAASGIGKATALIFADEGAKVAVADINRDGAEGTAREITAQGGEAQSFLLDVTSEDDWQRVINDIVNHWGSLNILINNAGISFAKPITEMRLDEWRRVMNINFCKDSRSETAPQQGSAYL